MAHVSLSGSFCDVISALKGTLLDLFHFTAAVVLTCDGRKTSVRTSSIVQIIFYFNPLRSDGIF